LIGKGKDKRPVKSATYSFTFLYLNFIRQSLRSSRRLGQDSVPQRKAFRAARLFKKEIT
jgi:hypothetical protein